MKYIPQLGTVTIIVITSTYGGWAAETRSSLPEDERGSVTLLIEKLVGLGLPDTKGGKYFVGTAVVRQRFDPSQKSPALPMRYCGKQSTVPGSKEMDYEFTVDGPHFERSNGSWLLGLQHVLKPTKDLEIVQNDLSSRDLAHARENAEAQFAFPAEEKLDAWFARVPEDRRSAMKMGAKYSMPLWQYFELHPSEPTLGTCYLLRAGVDDAGSLTYVIADVRCRDFWRMRYWDAEAYPFDPTGEYPGLDSVVENWPASDKPYPAEVPSVALRRDLHRYFFHLLKSSGNELPMQTVAALAHATLDPGDPQQIKRRIDMLVLAKKIPKVTPNDADLATRLSSWGEPDAEEQPNFQVLNTGSDQQPRISTAFVVPKPAYEPTPEDLPKLFELLSDNRPTRWTDFQGARTVGENALRAVAMIMKDNPLKLVDYAGLEPWTEARRKSANEALIKWWRANGSEYVSKLQK